MSPWGSSTTYTDARMASCGFSLFLGPKRPWIFLSDGNLGAFLEFVTVRWMTCHPRWIALGLALGLASSAIACGSTAADRPIVATPVEASLTRSHPEPISAEVMRRVQAVQPIVRRAARAHHLDPALINGVIWVESRFDPRAKSSAGARGLMQLMPKTARWLAESMGRRARTTDPEFNVAAGSYYLARLSRRYGGDLRWALAAYHAGPGNADRWRQRGQLPESSRRYVQRVFEARARFQRLLPDDTPGLRSDRRLARVSPAPRTERAVTSSTARSGGVDRAPSPRSTSASERGTAASRSNAAVRRDVASGSSRSNTGSRASTSKHSPASPRPRAASSSAGSPGSNAAPVRPTTTRSRIGVERPHTSPPGPRDRRNALPSVLD